MAFNKILKEKAESKIQNALKLKFEKSFIGKQNENSMIRSQQHRGSVNCNDSIISEFEHMNTN